MIARVTALGHSEIGRPAVPEGTASALPISQSNTQPDRSETPQLEMWGGVECTINRVHELCFDQLTRTGHRFRPEDLDRFAALGLRALRVPLLWEALQPTCDGEIDWRWADRTLSRLRELGIRPIVGLLHHGYGPRWTGLLNPDFATAFARYAALVAERYPWVEAYTPINEPLTTARFSGLYGHWYPHARSGATFGRLMLAQYRATVQAMRAIRTITSDAQLIQTEDLGKTSSTPILAYQRDFENERRWLTWDALSGLIGPTHPMWTYFHDCGVTDRELGAFLDTPCPPDIVGVNYYVTSERYLDDRLDAHPATPAGGNGVHTYVDVAAAHAWDAEPIGVGALLREAWDRYQRPLALTECHLGCTREEQLRWVRDIWTAAQQARADGIPVRAVTIWALLGSYDWNSLVTRQDGTYEAGPFDVRAPVPRRTALAPMICALATDGVYDHPVLAAEGWWRRGTSQTASHAPSSSFADTATTPVLILGANGTLGTALQHVCTSRRIAHRTLSRTEVDITDWRAVERALAHHRPWAVINAAGYVDVDRAESNVARCVRANARGPAMVAELCAARGIRFATYSSDLVFDGTKRGAYVESDLPVPLNVYGRSKWLAERRVLHVMPRALVIRTSAFFGPWDGANLVTQAVRTLQTGGSVVMPSDLVITPTYVPDLAHATLDLLLDDESGLWHLTNGTPITWRELVRQAAVALAAPTQLLYARRLHRMGFAAMRPSNSALRSERGWIMPPLENAIARYAEEVCLPTSATCLLGPLYQGPAFAASGGTT